MIEIVNPSESYKEHPGPILLLAGPGTGKTWQLAHRIQFLLQEQGASPDEIAVITFTNEAARNMREALTKEDLAIAPHNIPRHNFNYEQLGQCHSGIEASAIRFGRKLLGAAR